MIKKLTMALFLVLGLSSAAMAQEKPGIFIRHRPNDKNGLLQIAKATYESPKTKTKVVLYGVIHISDKKYYETVQKDLNSYDVVLYEGVGTPEEKKAMKGKKPKGFNVSMVQELMCEVLGLEFQLKAIDYKAKNLVHADMSMKDFQARMGGKSPMGPMPGGLDFLNDERMKPLIKLGRQLLRTLLKSNPEFQNSLRARLAQQLSQAADGKIPGMDPKMYQVLVVERNKVVMKVLDKELKKRNKGTVAIFYGAAHMPDFHQRMKKAGFKQTSKTWISAWPTGAAASEVKPAKPAKPVKKNWF